MQRREDPASEGSKLPRPGDVVAEKYEVERTIGSGGMGVVVAARHMGLGDRVALKFLVPRASDGTVDDHTLARFFREAQLTARIKSDHVARMLDVGGYETGRPFMVMELLDGWDLQRLIRERGPLPVPEATGYVLHACHGLAEAHALGIVHRDLKPGNLFLTRRLDGSPIVKVLDFGIGKIVTGVRGTFDRTLTTDADVLGSPLYMSPEQIRSPKDVDARSDLWSLGAILYTLLAGRPPFDADNAGSVLAMILSDAPDPLRARRPDIPPALDAVVLSCLEKDPNRRVQRAEELARGLVPFAAQAFGGRPWEVPSIAPVRPLQEPMPAPRPWEATGGSVVGTSIAGTSIPGTSIVGTSTVGTSIVGTTTDPSRPPPSRRGAIALVGTAVLAVAVAVPLTLVMRDRGASPGAPVASAAPLPAPEVKGSAPSPVAPTASAPASTSASSSPASSAAPDVASATAPSPSAARPRTTKGVKRVDVLEDRL